MILDWVYGVTSPNPEDKGLTNPFQLGSFAILTLDAVPLKSILFDLSIHLFLSLATFINGQEPNPKNFIIKEERI
jgi:hypothetical protein